MYQYPPPPGEYSSPRRERSYPVPPLITLERGQPQEVESGFTQTAESSTPGKNDNMKRATSNPNICGQSAADAALATAAEKRRNKLGYHRTSVACGHCRRRKIRCVLAPGDLENRCENCIRLKKECNFYPVDAAPSMLDGRSPRGVNGGRGDAGSTSSGSPVTHMYGDANRGIPYMPMKTMGVPSSTVPSNRHFIDGPARHVAPMFESQPEYPPPPNMPWLTPEPQSTTRQSESSYWSMRGQEVPLAPAFSPFQSDMHLPHSGWQGAAEASSRDEASWSAPNRPLSFGNMANVSHQSAYSQFSQPQGQPVGREGLAPRHGGQPPATYLRDLPHTGTLSSSSHDGAVSDHPSDISGPPQLPSFPAAQGSFPSQTQSLQSSTYGKHSLPSSAEQFGWYNPGGSVGSQGAGETSQTLPYGQAPPYSVMYYDDGPQGGR